MVLEERGQGVQGFVSCVILLVGLNCTLSLQFSHKSATSPEWKVIEYRMKHKPFKKGNYERKKSLNIS